MNKHYFRYEIEEYKNLIEGDLEKLKDVRPKYVSGLCSFEEYVALEEQILDAYDALEVMYHRSLFYKTFQTSGDSRLDYTTLIKDMDDDFKSAFTSIKHFIEDNFSDEEMYEFIFIIFSRCVSLLNEK